MTQFNNQYDIHYSPPSVLLLCIYPVHLFAHSSCISLLILVFIKSTVYYPAHFILLHIFNFLHCPLSGPDLTYISLLIIFCIIEYVTNKTLNWINVWCGLNHISIKHNSIYFSFYSAPDLKPSPLSIHQSLNSDPWLVTVEEQISITMWRSFNV